MTEEFLKFLKSMYDRLYKEGIITKKASTSKEKLKIILAYIEKISKIQNKAEENKEYLRRIKELYYKKYIIKESEIPNSYFEHLSKRYLEEGNGHLDLINPKTVLEKETRRMHVEEIIHTEKLSIDAWLDYLMSSESDHIPAWAKVWAFTGMLDIGVMNKETESFNRRRNGTIAPFVNINSEILGKSVMYLKMHLKLMPDEFFPNEEIKRLASTESFYQIYGHLLAKAIAIKPISVDGIWIKYGANSKEDALKLYKSLQGYYTGWCTAASEETAINQVCGGGSYPGGDFYVFYCKDAKGEYKIPRLAIRMSKDKIGEIRGIASNQNIEPVMTEILDTKLKEFPDSEKYKKKVRNMKKLTDIYMKYQQNQELTKEDLRFLYEIEEKIESFGYQKDPRIEEIISRRNKKIDLAKVFDCKEEEIGIEPESIKGKNFVYYQGSLNLCHYVSAEGLQLPKIITGNLTLSGLTSARGLQLPEMLGGNLDLTYLISVDGLKLPKYIGGRLDLFNLTSAKGLKFPKVIKSNLILSNLTSVEGLILPQEIIGTLYLDGLTINDLLNIKLPNNVGGGICLKDKVYSLEELKNLIAIKKEKLDLEAKKSIIECSTPIMEDNLKRGNINIWYILIPAFTLFLGVAIASIIYNL